jgi:hypothetical protein
MKPRLALLLCAILPLSAAAQAGRAQQVPGYCIPPDRPLLDAVSLQTLGLTLGEELTRYMSEAQSYSLCLDATKQQLYDEINQYLEQYRASVNE